MRIILRYVDDPGFRIGVAEDGGVNQSTVSLTIYSVMDAIIRKAHIWIKFPETVHKLESAKAEWQERYTFPDAIGALDCTHVLIKKPSIRGDYINRKGMPSVNVQATFNSKELFTSVDVTRPGSVHDSRIWKNSDVYGVMMENRSNALLLGDIGYGVAPWPITPYRNVISLEERSYNKCISVIIERCFGQVKQRFPILQNKIRLVTVKVSSVILCCFVLHNVAKNHNEDDFEIEENNNEEEAVQEDEGGRIRERGQRRREEIARKIHGFRN